MKIAKISTVLIALIATETLAWRPKYSLNPSKVVYALNCGSNQGFKSKDGFTYQGVRSPIKIEFRIDTSERG